MDRHPTAAPVERSGLWHRPLRVAALAYALGTAVATASFGLAAALEEQIPALPAMGRQRLAEMLTAALASAIVWGALVRLALALRPARADAMFLVVCNALALPKILMVVSMKWWDYLAPSISPDFGYLVAILSDPLLLASFVPVARLARRVEAGDTGDTPLDVSAAACAWAVSGALLGVVVAPTLDLRLGCALGSGAALLGLLRVHHLALRASAGADAAPAARRLVGKGIRRGASIVTIGGLLVVALRLVEQRTTLDPALRAVYRTETRYDRCPIRRVEGGRDGIVLVRVTCGNPEAPLLGWDERKGAVLEGEDLYQRLPEARPGAPASP